MNGQDPLIIYTTLWNKPYYLWSLSDSFMFLGMLAWGYVLYVLANWLWRKLVDK